MSLTVMTAVFPFLLFFQEWRDGSSSCFHKWALTTERLQFRTDRNQHWIMQDRLKRIFIYFRKGCKVISQVPHTTCMQRLFLFFSLIDLLSTFMVLIPAMYNIGRSFFFLHISINEQALILKAICLLHIEFQGKHFSNWISLRNTEPDIVFLNPPF